MDKWIDSLEAAAGGIVFSVKNKMRELPCLLVLTAVLSAVLPYVAGFRPTDWLSMILPAALTSAVWFLSDAKTAFFRSALPAFAGLCSVLFNLNFRQNDSLSELIHARTAVNVEAEIRICDPSLYHYDGNSSASSRKCLCQVTSLRFGPSDRWSRFQSAAMTFFPPETANLKYGDCYRIRGVLQCPSELLLPEGFDYRDYLKRKGIHFLLYADHALRLREEGGFYAVLLSARNRLLHALTGSMNRPETRALAAAMLFGCRQELSPEARSAFTQSGIIHVLSVSGLHIGMFAGAVFLLLLPVPFRWRLLLTPFLTLLYGFAAGMQMPAVRALLMLFCWCIPRAFMLRGNSLNSVLLAGSLLLIWNPVQLKDAGFQYSFCCVFFLLLTASETASWLHLIFEKNHWIPDQKQSKMKWRLIRWTIALLSAAAGCLTAWLCSSALTVFHQGLIIPFAMIANLLILPAVYLVFFLFVLAVLPCLLFPGMGKMFAPLLKLPLNWIETSGRLFAEWSDGRVPVPPGWTVLAALTALWLLFVFSRRKAGIAGFCVLIAIWFFWCSELRGKPEAELLLLHGGRQKIPALILSAPEADFSLAANLADYRCAVAAADYLKRRGHRNLTVLACSGTAGEYTSGARYLPDWIPVGHYLAKTSRRNGTARQAEQKAEKNGSRLHLQTGNRLEWSSGGEKIKTFSENGEFSFDIWQNEHTVHIRMVSDPFAGSDIRISASGGTGKVLKLPREREPGIFRMKLKW